MFPPPGGCSGKGQGKIGFVPLPFYFVPSRPQTAVIVNTPVPFFNSAPKLLIQREFASNSNISTLQNPTPRCPSKNPPRHLHDSTTDKEVKNTGVWQPPCPYRNRRYEYDSPT